MSLLISNLSFKRKKEAILLEDINLSVDAGDLIIIQGESGCGKTTLLNIIAGLIKPIKGLVKLNDEVLNSQEKFIPPEERNIGYVFQDYALFPHLTALKNANYAYKNNSPQLTDDYVLESLNLVNHKNKYPYELSGGQQQRIAIARAILMQPDALIMDEPFSGLDKENIINTQQLLSHAIKILNIPAVMVTHSLEHIDKMYCKEIIKI